MLPLHFKSLIAAIVLVLACLLPAEAIVERKAVGKPQVITELGTYGTSVLAKIGNARFYGTALTYVRSGGHAQRVGFLEQDIVLTVNRTPTPSPERLNQILNGLKGRTKTFDCMRAYGQRNVITINQGEGWTSTGETVKPRPSQPELESYMVKLVNEDRSKQGLSSLRVSSSLGRMARSYADDMAKRDFSGHTDPEGRNPWERAKIAGIQSMDVRENCAYPGPMSDAYRMVAFGERQLMESPEHRVSIVAQDIVCVGIGIAFRKDGGLKVVQVFSGADIP